LFTCKLNIVHSNIEHCSILNSWLFITKRSLFTNKVNIVHLQTEHWFFVICLLICKMKWSDRNFTKLKTGFCLLINWTLITHKLDIVYSQTEHCSLTSWTLFTHKLNIVHSQAEDCSLTNWTLILRNLPFDMQNEMVRQELHQT